MPFGHDIRLRRILGVLGKNGFSDGFFGKSKSEIGFRVTVADVGGYLFETRRLARKFSMSDSHFSRTFKEYTGIGVAQYIKLTRLRAAEKLLLNKTGSITDIALACGFNNSNYFICDFKKHYGITPLQFAINMRKG